MLHQLLQTGRIQLKESQSLHVTYTGNETHAYRGTVTYIYGYGNSA